MSAERRRNAVAGMVGAWAPLTVGRRLLGAPARGAGAEKGVLDMNGRSIRTVAVALLAAAALSAGVAGVTAHADPPVARDAGVIIRWNEITERTLIENNKPVPMWLVYLGFTSLAMYDAVVTIEGRYEPWSELPRAQAHASPEVAAATAAYRVLIHYFPNSEERADERLRGRLERRSGWRRQGARHPGGRRCC